MISVMSAVPNLLTDFFEVEKFVEAQPEGTHAEIVRGVYLFSPRPRFRHLKAQGRLLGFLESRYGGVEGDDSAEWTFASEPELRSERSFSRLIPDVAGWRRSTGWPGPDESLISLVPDFVAEVLSPGTEEVDRGPKREAYGLMGVGWVWILDPVAKTVETFANVRGTMVPGPALLSSDLIAAPPFENLTLRVEALFIL
jgi:Uma2 family endonuclease